MTPYLSMTPGSATKVAMRIFYPLLAALLLSPFLMTLSGCAETQIVESPRTAYVSDTGEPAEPRLIWTSRSLEEPFEYLGQITTRSWTYDGALERLKDAGREMRADAIIDIHFERLGFFKTMHAFAIKFK